MSADELAKETSTFDGGAVPVGRRLSAEQRRKWDRARGGGSASMHAGPGRPKIGEGAVAVPVSIEAALLRRAIAKAEALKLKRSEYFAKALELLTDGEVAIGGTRLRVAADVGKREGKSVRSEMPRRAVG
jgi:hypothetical protein